MAAALPATAAAAASNHGEAHAASVECRAIGVDPLINSKGTFTIITGSQTLPEVKKAMDEASRSYVQMDELMAGVSKKSWRRLPGLTGAL